MLDELNRQAAERAAEKKFVNDKKLKSQKIKGKNNEEQK